MTWGVALAAEGHNSFTPGEISEAGPVPDFLGLMVMVFPLLPCTAAEFLREKGGREGDWEGVIEREADGGGAVRLHSGFFGGFSGEGQDLGLMVKDEREFD